MLRLVTISLLMLTATACAAPVASPRPPIFTVGPRPAITDLRGFATDDGLDWIVQLIEAYVRNCVTLRTLRHEDPLRCKDGLE